MGAGDTPYNKPGKELVDLALKKADICKEEGRVFFVGDALADMNCADASKTLPVLMRMCTTDVTDEWIEKRKKLCQPLWVLENHFELQELMREYLPRDEQAYFKRMKRSIGKGG